MPITIGYNISIFAIGENQSAGPSLFFKNDKDDEDNSKKRSEEKGKKCIVFIDDGRLYDALGGCGIGSIFRYSYGLAGRSALRKIQWYTDPVFFADRCCGPGIWDQFATGAPREQRRVLAYGLFGVYNAQLRDFPW